jgi:hypothetical protein
MKKVIPIILVIAWFVLAFVLEMTAPLWNNG